MGAEAIRRIGVFTSGGDAPGMNACIRAVVRTALHHGLEVIGIRRGYAGMIEGDFVEMDAASVSNIIQLGGTILKSARSEAFKTPEGRARAAQQLQQAGIQALVAIGGDGTFRGASIFHEEYGFPIVGCPGTIDNDLFGTDETIGYDTAVNTALQAIDKIRDTADAHDRLFFIEVMGRDSGFIALACAIGGGAELVLVPEAFVDLDEIRESLYRVLAHKRRSSIVVVAEGDELGGAQKLAEKLRPIFPDYEMRVTVLGHIQRGGSPTARDRMLATRLGVAAVEALLDGHDNVMVGVINNEIHLTPLRNTWSKKKTIDYDLLRLVQLLS
jgi:6-phosphofructokinase 1|nr:MAG: ATP-dependent 6-phosphofructokinase [Bacteroidota bacterium]